jgi:uncharacterized protein YajQ (UPF0234 family)
LLTKIKRMPSFDIVSKVDIQALDNAVNVTNRELANRFDFRGSHLLIELDKKTFQLKLETEDDMKMGQLLDVLVNRAHKQGIAPEAFEMSKEGSQSGKIWRKEVKVRNGLAQEEAKKIVKLIKDGGLKVQASIHEDLVRVTGKKIDDLQAVMQQCRSANIEVPLQYVNMRD